MISITGISKKPFFIPIKVLNKLLTKALFMLIQINLLGAQGVSAHNSFTDICLNIWYFNFLDSIPINNYIAWEIQITPKWPQNWFPSIHIKTKCMSQVRNFFHCTTTVLITNLGQFLFKSKHFFHSFSQHSCNILTLNHKQMFRFLMYLLFIFHSYTCNYVIPNKNPLKKPFSCPMQCVDIPGYWVSMKKNIFKWIISLLETLLHFEKSDWRHILYVHLYVKHCYLQWRVSSYHWLFAELAPAFQCIVELPTNNWFNALTLNESFCAIISLFELVMSPFKSLVSQTVVVYMHYINLITWAESQNIPCCLHKARCRRPCSGREWMERAGKEVKVSV